MTDQQAEVDRLRAEVESYRQRELAALHAALADARTERDNYRNEALRNADVGRQIDRDYRKIVEALRAKLELYTNPRNASTREIHAARN